VKDLKYTSGNADYIKQELLKLDSNKSYRLSISEWKEKRGISANNQQHLWYAQIAKHNGDETALDVKNFCKDAIGLPILLNSDKHGDKMEFLLHKLDYYRHSHESRMKLIQCLEVTSLFNTAESKQYMEQMIFYYNDNGIMIKFKD
tara:strand:- start:31200 stop:31637 length:438 start_codon:yes stop_codon:yes gene_type:complete